jgi:putative selenate reductase FAD-binding subunit
MSDYVMPSSIEEALAAGERTGAEYLAGGTWVNRRVNSRPRPSVLVSLSKLGLDYIRSDDEGIHIGSMACFQSLVDRADLPVAIKAAAGVTASRTLRNMMTIGGDIALASNSSCIIPSLMVLGAEIAAASGPVDVSGYVKQEKRDLIVEVRIPDQGLRTGFLSLSRTSHSPKSLVCAVAVRVEEGIATAVRISLGDCVSAPFHLSGTEGLLTGRTLPDRSKIGSLVCKEFCPKPDIHASEDYKRYLAGVYVADLLHDLAAQEGVE